MPTSFCIISQLPIFDFLKSWVLKAHEAYVTPTEALQYSTRPQEKKYSLEFHLSFLFHHLYYNSEWKNEVLITHSRKSKLGSYRNYRANGFALPNFNYRTLMTTMKPNRILELVQYLLLEKKILLVQSQYADNAIIIESLLSLLYPL